MAKTLSTPFNYQIPTMTSSPSLAMISSGVQALPNQKLMTTTSSSLFSS